MQKVYFENKTFVFSSEPPLAGHQFVLADEVSTPAKLLQKIGNNNTLHIVSSSPKNALDNFCASFHFIKAAGGIVENGSGEVLMIFRRGHWDLPKGKAEAGERIEDTALREIEEETGLANISLNGEICSTLHFYNTYGRWEMKRTWWYSARYDGNACPIPQTEEDISRAEWVDKAQLAQLAESSYATIRDVVRTYLNIQNK